MKKKSIDYNLWKKYKSTKNPEEKHELRNKLVEKYYPFVQQIAYKVAERLCWNVTPQELTSFGVDGLYIAIDRFDLSRNIKFESYANIRIHGSMLDGVRKEDMIPRSVRINNNKFEQVKNKLESEKNRSVSEEEIIVKLGIEYKKYFKNVKKYNPASYCSIDGLSVTNNNDDGIKKDQNINLIDKNSSLPDSKLRRKEFFNKLLSQDFTYLEQNIIYLYYWENMTMENIAKKTELSESRVSQIHKSLLFRLKDKIKRNPKYFGKDIYEYVENCNGKESLF